MSLPRLALLLLCCLVMSERGSLNFAQTNPPVAACGLPAQGAIRQSVTYTLSADCVQTGTLTIANTIAAITVTINGGGHTITGGAFFLFHGISAILNLNDVTIDGANVSIPNLIWMDTTNASNVTITRANGLALIAVQANLNNVLFSWNRSPAFSLGGNANSLNVKGAGTNHTLTNVVFRNNIRGGGAAVVHSGATLTTNGCLSFSGNAPYDVYVNDGGTWTDNSTGPCSGAIGNGGQAVIPPALMACGFPAAGSLDVSATYTLTADCELTGAYYISEQVSIGVIGNGNTISSISSGQTFFTAATSSLRLENVALEGVRFFHWGELIADSIKVSDTVGGILYNLGVARFTNALFEDNSTANAASRSVALAYNAYQKGFISFTNATFRNNSGGLGGLASFGAVIELNGCIHFENNSPVDAYIYPGRGGTVTDNRDPNCDSPIVDPVVLVLPVQSDPPKAKCNPRCDLPEIPIQEECDLKLGAIGLICRPRVQPPELYVYRISAESEGFFKLGVSQPQVEAVAEGLVACSADGRVAIRTGMPPEIRHFFEIDPKYREELLTPRRYIVVSKGPNVEGKVNHVVLDNALSGRVFGIVSTFGGPPAAECIARQAVASAPATTSSAQYAPLVQPQTARPDGSIVHIVRPGDTINRIAVAYETDPLDIIIVNQLEDMGHWIYPGQELLVREADA